MSRASVHEPGQVPTSERVRRLVLALGAIDTGLSNAELAAKLGLSEGTAERWRRRARAARAAAERREQIAVMALRQGIDRARRLRENSTGPLGCSGALDGPWCGAPVTCTSRREIRRGVFAEWGCCSVHQETPDGSDA